MPSTNFQKQIREQLVEIIGFRPRHYDILKSTGAQRLKWVSFDAKMPTDTFIRNCSRLILELAYHHVDQLKSKLHKRPNGYTGAYLSIWIPAHVNIKEQLETSKRLRKIERYHKPTEKEKHLEALQELHKALRENLNNTQSLIHTVNRKISELASS